MVNFWGVFLWNFGGKYEFIEKQNCIGHYLYHTRLIFGLRAENRLIVFEKAVYYMNPPPAYQGGLVPLDESPKSPTGKGTAHMTFDFPPRRAEGVCGGTGSPARLVADFHSKL